MPDLRRVHRFRDHAVAGVNWRPTRFVDEVHSSRVCALCRMIPKTTVLLPCSHVLCQSCHAANSQGCGGRCPLDQEPFEEDECVSYDLPTRTANALKVHCWNEAHGCEFEGSMEVILAHYDNDCTFHIAECLRCGEEVLHTELSTHYVAGCGAAVSVVGTKNSSSESGALTLEDVTGALQELETLLRNDNHKKLLPAIQCAINEVIEQIGNQESGLAVFPHNVAALVKADMAQAATPSPSTSLPERTSQENPTEDASTSSASRLKETATLQKPEPFAEVPEGVMKAMSNTSTQDYPKHAITYLLEGVKCQLELIGMLSTTRTWTKVREIVTYVVTVENVPTHKKLRGTNIAYMTVLHTRDSYFTVHLYGFQCKLGVRIQFHGMHHRLTFPAPFFKVDLSRMYPPGSYWHGDNCECYATTEAQTQKYKLTRQGRYAYQTETPGLKSRSRLNNTQSRDTRERCASPFACFIFLFLLFR